MTPAMRCRPGSASPAVGERRPAPAEATSCGRAGERQGGRPAPGRWGDRRRRRIGLLGGSFNPAHGGHRHVAETALRALRLDEVWLLVSPGNPLKPRAGMAPFAHRLASARRIADGRRILASDWEARKGTRYTVDTLAALRRHFPRASFVLLLGADNLAQLPRWRRWTELARRTPIAVFPRPGWTFRALAGQAARRLARHRRRPAALMDLAEAAATADGGVAAQHAPWAFVPAAENRESSTAIRRATAESGKASNKDDPRPPPAARRCGARVSERPGTEGPRGST